MSRAREQWKTPLALAEIDGALDAVFRAYRKASDKQPEVACVIRLDGKGSIRANGDLTRAEIVSILRQFADTVEARSGPFAKEWF